MKKQKSTSKLLLGLGVLCAALSISLCPAAGITARAATHDPGIAPCSDNIGYRYYKIGNKWYKQLYNFSKEIWIGDPIYIGEAS